MAIYSLEDRHPILPADDLYWVAENATVIGDVELGDNVGIWFGAVLRGDNERLTIGAGTNIQDQSMLHTDPGFPLNVGEGCTIGHQAILHGCTIGDNTLVGMGATIMNGAVVGKNCLVGANALIPEKKVIPDNSLVVGMPGEVLRELGEGAIQALKGAALNYVANWKRFKAHLKRID